MERISTRSSGGSSGGLATLARASFSSRQWWAANLNRTKYREGQLHRGRDFHSAGRQLEAAKFEPGQDELRFAACDVLLDFARAVSRAEMVDGLASVDEYVERVREAS